MFSRSFRHVFNIFFPATHRVAFAIVVAGVRVEGAQLHPAETHLVLSGLEEAADISSGLQREQWRQDVGGARHRVSCIVLDGQRGAAVGVATAVTAAVINCNPPPKPVWKITTRTGCGRVKGQRSPATDVPK